MKKIYILSLALCLLFSINVNGQFLKKLFSKEYHQGVALLDNGDTLKGEFVFSNSYENYIWLDYRDSVSKEITTYKPKTVRSFTIDSMHFFTKPLKKRQVFMQLLKDDSLKLYLHRYLQATAYYSATYNLYVFEKPDGQRLEIYSGPLFAFKNKVSSFFSDYPELAEKINDKTYKYDDLYLISDEYNKWLKQKGSKK